MGRSATGRRQRTRAMQGIDQSGKVNRALWLLAEGMKRLKGRSGRGAARPFSCQRYQGQKKRQRLALAFPHSLLACGGASNDPFDPGSLRTAVQAAFAEQKVSSSGVACDS